MVKSADAQQEGGAADRSAELGRMAAEILQGSPLMSMNPLISHPVAAMAAATAIGFSVTTQMAGAFLGALQGAFDVTNRLAASIDARNELQPEASVEPLAAAASLVPEPAVKPAPVKAKTIKATAVVAKVAAAPKPAQANSGTTAKTDDLKRISGIGPKLEQVLNQRGISSVADIAAWTEADIARFDGELGFDGRIARDDWVGHAKLLAAKASGRK
ncbi:helix-hairpin-helix domain-containing protein [Rhizobium sp. 2YAF20]|uniref:helix-hairpin-helix domain-containing protein n=1 Tax=Rhizobium sp. 2YAF20 TaxID=3233027 RepID=UPI003F968BD3